MVYLLTSCCGLRETGVHKKHGGAQDNYEVITITYILAISHIYMQIGITRIDTEVVRERDQGLGSIYRQARRTRHNRPIRELGWAPGLTRHTRPIRGFGSSRRESSWKSVVFALGRTRQKKEKSHGTAEYRLPQCIKIWK